MKVLAQIQSILPKWRMSPVSPPHSGSNAGVLYPRMDVATLDSEAKAAAITGNAAALVEFD
jgi:hypothetical protein